MYWSCVCARLWVSCTSVPFPFALLSSRTECPIHGLSGWRSPSLSHSGGCIWHPFAVPCSPPPPHGGLLIGGPGNGAPPPSESSPYAIVYNPRAETKHIPKVYDAAPLNDRLKELIGAVIFVSIDHGCFAKLGPLQGFNFFTSIH